MLGKYTKKLKEERRNFGTCYRLQNRNLIKRDPKDRVDRTSPNDDNNETLKLPRLEKSLPKENTLKGNFKSVSSSLTLLRTYLNFKVGK